MNAIRKLTPKTVCPLTSSSSVSFRYEKNGLGIYKNNDTGLHFVHPQPSSDEIAAIYNKDYFAKGNKYAPSVKGIERPQLVNDKRRIKMIKHHVSSGRLLDVGCAKGDFLGVAKDSGFEVSGVEVSEYAALEAKEKYGIPVEIGTLEQARFEEASFDIITLWDVIEHLPNPHDTISYVSRFLKPGGFFFVSTGDISSMYARTIGKHWHLMTPPEHLFFFTPDSISALLEEHGLIAKKFHYPGKTACLDFIFFKLQQSIGAPGRFLQRANAKLGLGGKQLYVNLFDIMSCVAQKK